MSLKTITMKFAFLSLLTLTVLFGACKKKNSNNDLVYIPGTLYVGLKAATPADSCFSVANRVNLNILVVNGYNYKSPLPKDSVDALKNLLFAKKYIDTFQPGSILPLKTYVYYSALGYTSVAAILNFMDTASQRDWIQTIGQLNLTEVIATNTDSPKMMQVSVPVGKEQYYKDLILTNSNVSWVMFDYQGTQYSY